MNDDDDDDDDDSLTADHGRAVCLKHGDAARGLVHRSVAIVDSNVRGTISEKGMPV